MKCFFLILLFSLIFAFTSQGQKRNNIDVGPFIGSTYYMGDLNMGKQLYSPNIAAGIVARFPINKRYTFRGNAIYGIVEGSDIDFGSYQQARRHTFKNQIIELSAMFELNYLPYKDGSEKEYYTPYVAAGLGGYFCPEIAPPVQLVFPFGMGFKYNVNKKLNISLEWMFRRTFTDKLDNLSGVRIEDLASKQLASYSNKDWYSFVGVILTYKFKLRRNVCYME